MINSTCRAAATGAFVVIALFVALAAPPALSAASEPSAREPARCFDARAGKRKTSLGIHQWTARMEVHWCVEERDGRRAIVSVARATRIRTGTNWKLISRSGGVDRSGRRRAAAVSRFHFRLRYPYLEQNCYPRLTLEVLASGRFERSVSTGC